MLNLDCPNCGKPHRIDNAFRGGVARCDSCGALIHVPTKDGKPIEAQSGRAKRPAAPTGECGHDGEGRPARRRQSGARVRHARRLPGKPVAVTLTLLIVALSAAAIWVIYQTAMTMRGAE